MAEIHSRFPTNCVCDIDLDAQYEFMIRVDQLTSKEEATTNIPALSLLRESGVTSAITTLNIWL